jgi:putative transposase
MIEPNNPDLSIGEQCRLLSISRSSFYYQPKGETALNLMLMRQIDEQFLETPFFGVRQMTWYLRNEGHLVNEKRIRRLMRLMGLMPIYQKPNTSKAAKDHKTYPYLLRGLRVTRPNQVWAADITYLPMRKGVLYLVAIMDWHTRKVLAWRISNTLEADFCVDALNEAIARFGPSEIMNTDQGSQFTSFAWTDRLRRSGVRISMDGKGRFLDAHLRGTALAVLEIRMRLPARLGERLRGEGGRRQVDRVLQPQAPPFRPWRQTPSRGLLAEKRRNPTRSAGAESSLSYAKTCPNIGE